MHADDVRGEWKERVNRDWRRQGGARITKVIDQTEDKRTKRRRAKRESVPMRSVSDDENERDEVLTCTKHDATLASVAVRSTLALALAFPALIARCAGRQRGRGTDKEACLCCSYGERCARIGRVRWGWRWGGGRWTRQRRRSRRGRGWRSCRGRCLGGRCAWASLSYRSGRGDGSGRGRRGGGR